MTTQNLPAYLSNRRPTGLTASVTQGLSSGSPPMLSIRSNRFTLIDAAGNEKPLQTLYADVVIVQANPTVSKVYYAEAFDPSSTEYKPPTCFSDNGIGPSRQSQTPQSPTCATCPNNVWGSSVSKMTGKQSKACNDVKKLAVVMADNPDMPFLLRVPPASLKHLSAYAKTIAAQSAGNRQAEVSDVVTRITFETNANGILNFSAVSWVDEKAVQVMEKIWDTKGADDLVGLNDTPYQATPNQLANVLPSQQLPPPPQQSLPPGRQAVETPANPVQSTQATSAPPASATQDTPRRRGRPPKAKEEPAFMATREQAEVQVATVLGKPVELQYVGKDQSSDIPAFLRRDNGIVQQAPQPSPELNAALEKAMNLPLPGVK